MDCIELILDITTVLINFGILAIGLYATLNWRKFNDLGGFLQRRIAFHENVLKINSIFSSLEESILSLYETHLDELDKEYISKEVVSYVQKCLKQDVKRFNKYHNACLALYDEYAFYLSKCQKPLIFREFSLLLRESNLLVQRIDRVVIENRVKENDLSDLRARLDSYGIFPEKYLSKRKTKKYAFNALKNRKASLEEFVYLWKLTKEHL